MLTVLRCVICSPFYIRMILKCIVTSNVLIAYWLLYFMKSLSDRINHVMLSSLFLCYFLFCKTGFWRKTKDKFIYIISSCVTKIVKKVSCEKVFTFCAPNISSFY